MITLGLIILLVLCLFLTVAAAGCILGEVWYSESLSPFSWILSGVAALFWALLLYIQPFQVVIK